MPLLLVVFGPALAAALFVFLPRLAKLAALIPAFTFIYLVTRIGAAETLSVSIPWAPSFGLTFSFFADGLGLLFGLIISGIGALILLYTTGYFAEDADYTRFTTYTLLFMTAMLGTVFSGNILLLFVFWEITSVTSYLLIGFRHEQKSAREGARRALIITGGGGLALLAGFVLLGSIGGTFDLPKLLQNGDAIRRSPLYSPALILIIIGAFSKSAQWPLHFWLPGAMDAPTPTSAYLHSATMVKAGIFLLARLSPALNNTDLWFYTLTVFGLVTFVYGALMALRQTDLKAILAYSTVSWLGALVALQGPGTEDGAKALVIGIVAHALYKGALFLAAGAVDHATGTRDIRQLGRLAGTMRFTVAGAIIAVLSMAGIPPLLGFMAKETLKVTALGDGLRGIFGLLFPIAAVAGSALTVAVGLRFLWDTFFGSKTAEMHSNHGTPHEVSPAMWIGSLALGALAIAIPFTLPQTLEPVVNLALRAILGTPSAVHLHLFEGINWPFVLSVIAIALGGALFWFREPLFKWLNARPAFDPTAIYTWLFGQALPEVADKLTRRLQSGRLRDYIVIILGTFAALILGTVFLGRANLIGNRLPTSLDWEGAILCLILIVGAIAGVIANTRLGAITVLGIEGAMVALLFGLFGAPDLALTQLMIEVVSIVLFVLAFHFLPNTFTFKQPRVRLIRDIVVAGIVGATVTILILVARANPIGESISPWYIQNTLPVGQGQNVVNVILVDFRGLDTQGEIVVLVIAAMGVAALLRLRPSDQPRGKHLTSDMQEADTATTTENIPVVDSELVSEEKS